MKTESEIQYAVYRPDGIALLATASPTSEQAIFIFMCHKRALKTWQEWNEKFGYFVAEIKLDKSTRL